MSKVFGMHEIELQPVAEPEEYERVSAEEIASSFTLRGWKTHLLKGERGTRDGKYLVLLEIESLEARDRYFPRQGGESEEFTRFLEQHPEAAAAFEKWQKMGPFGSKTDTSPSLNSHRRGLQANRTVYHALTNQVLNPAAVSLSAGCQ
jgi:hypothetical protein